MFRQDYTKCKNCGIDIPKQFIRISRICQFCYEKKREVKKMLLIKTDFKISEGLKCTNCGKKYLGNYNINTFGTCKCGCREWIRITRNSKNTGYSEETRWEKVIE